MGLFQLLFILFLIVPIVEIYLLIKVGSAIGALFTVGLVVFTAILGAWLLRIQGFATLARVRSTVARGGVPAIEVLEGVVLLVSGALLLTPGFFTDAIGFFCLVPAFRRTLIHWVLGRFLTPFTGRGGPKGPRGGASEGDSSRKGPTTLEGEFRREDD